jgi:hypothetical protein
MKSTPFLYTVSYRKLSPEPPGANALPPPAVCGLPVRGMNSVQPPPPLAGVMPADFPDSLKERRGQDLQQRSCSARSGRKTEKTARLRAAPGIDMEKAPGLQPGIPP